MVEANNSWDRLDQDIIMAIALVLERSVSSQGNYKRVGLLTQTTRAYTDDIDYYGLLRNLRKNFLEKTPEAIFKINIVQIFVHFIAVLVTVIKTMPRYSHDFLSRNSLTRLCQG
jgi:hypothetical protein